MKAMFLHTEIGKWYSASMYGHHVLLVDNKMSYLHEIMFDKYITRLAFHYHFVANVLPLTDRMNGSKTVGIRGMYMTYIWS